MLLATIIVDENEAVLFGARWERFEITRFGLVGISLSDYIRK
jgi:hypothetical protein